MKGDRTVTVITATIGHPELGRALESVCAQSYENIEHWVVVDGPEFADSVAPIVEGVWRATKRGRLLVLPQRTGMDGWCSHRIYAATPILVNTDFVCFLDQDNWFDPEHLAALVNAIDTSGEQVAYAFRTIRSPDGAWVCRDECQSLGPLRESFDTPGQHHIDTNCWLLATQVAIRFSGAWLQRYHGDRRFARAVMKAFPGIPGSNLYSVNYTVASRRESATAEYFLAGNRRYGK